MHRRPNASASLGQDTSSVSRLALVFGAAVWAAVAPSVSAGAVAWRLPATRGIAGTPAQDGGRLFVVDGDVLSVDAATGKPEWRAPLLGYLPRCLVAASGLVYAAEEVVRALDAKTGAERWRFAPDGHAALGCPAVDSDTLFVGTSHGQVHALDRRGKERWKATLAVGDQPALVRGITRFGDALYVAAEQWLTPRGERATGWVVALAVRTGAMLWRARIGKDDERRGASASPAVGETLVVVGDAFANALVAFDRATGRLAWEFRGLPGHIGIVDPPRLVGKRVLAVSGDRHVYALAAANGALLWSAKLPAGGVSLAVCDGAVVATYQGLAAIELETGRILGTSLDGDSDFVASGVLAGERRVFVGGPKALYAVECGAARGGSEGGS